MFSSRIRLSDPENITLQDTVTSDWEDVTDSENISQRPSTNAGSSHSLNSTGSGARKRRRGTKHASTVTSPSNSTVVKAKRPRPPIFNREDVEDGARSTIQYGYDVVTIVFRYMKRPLALFACLWMIAFLMSYMTNAIRNALFPLCFIPGMGRSTLCTPPQPTAPLPQLPDFPGLMKAQGMFEQLVGESVGGSALSVEVLKAEMATRDLSTLVRYSDLKSKDSVANMLFSISVDAKKTARGLTKLNSKVAGAVDEYVFVVL